MSRFRAEVAQWAAKIGVWPKRVQIQRMTTKWASCSTAGRLTFSSDLIRENPPFREFVIVHELLHLLVPNHGKLFKSLLKAYLPQWEKAAQGRVRVLSGHHDPLRFGYVAPWARRRPSGIGGAARKY